MELHLARWLDICGTVIRQMTNRIYLIGHPVSHSVSPIFQQAALDFHSVDALYQAIDVDSPSLPKVISHMRYTDVLGANVTVPHKEAVVSMMDIISDEVKAIGAVNTIENRNGILVGHNTDAIGFSRALGEYEFDPQGKTALVLGAGGSAKAVISALVNSGIYRIVIANRTLERALSLVDGIRYSLPHSNAIDIRSSSIGEIARESDLVVNCTSLGMKGSTGEAVLPLQADGLSADTIVFDLVYNPSQTLFLTEAATVGATTVNGLSMLVHQGAASFEIWTGLSGPKNVMMEAAYGALEERR